MNFAVTLSGTYHAKKPHFSIWINEDLILHSEIAQCDVPQIFSFIHDISPGEHRLNIRLENKNDIDTIVKDDVIVNDMLLNILDITIDGISLGQMLWNAKYILDKPQKYKDKIITELDNCVNLGWNGTYTFKFNSPFQIWLLEQLN